MKDLSQFTSAFNHHEFHFLFLFCQDPTLVIGSGLSMEEMIFEVADTHLFFNDLEVRDWCFWGASSPVRSVLGQIKSTSPFCTNPRKPNINLCFNHVLCYQIVTDTATESIQRGVKFSRIWNQMVGISKFPDPSPLTWVREYERNLQNLQDQFKG